MVISGCPRVDIQATALQLLQLLDKRFFGTVGLLQSDKEKGKTSMPHAAELNENTIFVVEFHCVVSFALSLRLESADHIHDLF